MTSARLMILFLKNWNGGGGFMSGGQSYLYWRILAHFSHALTQAQGPHVAPRFFDVFETGGFSAGFAGIPPAEWILTVSRPDGILIFVIYNGLIDRRVFCFRVVRIHVCLRC